MNDAPKHVEPSNALLLVLLEPPAQLEEEFNDWYDSEHFPQRMGVPGFVHGERWVATSGWPRYLARYQLSNRAVLDSVEYLAISGSNNSAWSKRILPRTIGRQRLVLDICSQTLSPAQPSSLSVITWTLERKQSRDDFIEQARALVETLAGVLEVQWCQHEDLVICLIGFDHIINQQVIIPFSRIGEVGTSMMNIYLRYRR
jgi:hypothetical protein